MFVPGGWLASEDAIGSFSFLPFVVYCTIVHWFVAYASCMRARVRVFLGLAHTNLHLNKDVSSPQSCCFAVFPACCSAVFSACCFAVFSACCFAFLRAAPRSFLRAAPRSFLCTAPRSFLRAAPRSFLRAAPQSFLHAALCLCVLVLLWPAQQLYVLVVLHVS